MAPEAVAEETSQAIDGNEVPIAANKGTFAVSETAPADASAEVDVSQLSMAERLVHKAWKVRLDAYKDVQHALQQADPAADAAIFREHAECMRRAPLEANAAAQEAAVACLVAFLRCHEVAMRTRSSLVPALLEKALTSAKPTTKANAMESLMLLAEAEGNPNVVVEDMLPILQNKQPKLIASSLSALKEMVKAFGCPAVSWKAIAKSLGESIFGNADKNVRAEAMALVQELFRWGKDPVLASLENVLRPVQLKELQEACASITGPAMPSRGRGAVAVSSNPASASSSMDIDPFPIAEAAVVKEDDYDTAEAEDILAKIPDQFYELLQSAKWKDRKDILDAYISSLKGVQRAAEGRFGELIQILCRHIATDANVPVIISSSQLLEIVCRTARGSLMGHRGDIIIPSLLERSKEKKANLLEALRATLDACTLGVASAMDIAEHVFPFLKHKNPTCKAESLGFLARLLKRPFKRELAKKDLKALVDAILPTLDDGTSEVRDAGVQAVVACIHRGGESVVLPMVSEKLDKAKLAKVREALGSEPKKAEASKSAVPPPTATMPVKKSASMDKVKEPVVAKKPSPMEPTFRFSDADAMNYWSDNYGGVFAGLSDGNWKARLEAISSLRLDASIEPELAVRMLAARPGWKESNLAVMAKVLDVLTVFFSAKPANVESMSLLVTGLNDKFGEAKLSDALGSLFHAVGQHCPQYAFSQVLSQTIMLKSPKASIEALKFLKDFLLDHGAASLPSQTLPGELSFVRQLLNNANGQVRTAALELAAAMKGFHGAHKVKEYLTDLSPALMSSLEAELAKVPNQLEPRKSPQMLAKPVAATNASAEPSVVLEEDANVDRRDISADLPLIMGKLGDSNWKLRKEGLDELMALLKGKTSCSQASELMFSLKGRFNDTNKNLVAQALDAAATLTESLARTAFDKASLTKSGIVAGAASCLADNKPQVRQSAVTFLGKLSTIATPSIMSGLLREELKAESPHAKKELITLLSIVLSFPNSEDELAMAAILGCLQDRNGDVRKAVQTAVAKIASSVGSESVIKACQKFHPTMLGNVQSLLKSSPAQLAAAKATDDELVLPADKKASRLERDKSLPSNFWSIAAGDKTEQTNELKETQSPCKLFSYLFSTTSTDELKALNALCVLMEKEPQTILANVDLVAKLLVTRLPDSNATRFGKLMELVEAVLAASDKANQRLSEFEATAVVESLVHKSAHTSTTPACQTRIKSVYRQLCRVYPASRLFSAFLELGMAASLTKVKCEYLSELKVLLTRNGQSVLMQPARSVELLADAFLNANTPREVKRLCKEVLAQTQELLGSDVFAKLVDQLHNGKGRLLEELQKPVSALATPKKAMAVDSPAATTPKSARKEQTEPSETAMMEVDAENPFAEVDDPFKPKSQFGVSSMQPMLRTPFEQEHPIDQLIDLLTCTPDLQCLSALEKIYGELSSESTEKAPLLTRMELLVHAMAVRLKEATSNLSVQADFLEAKSQVVRSLCTCLELVLGNADYRVEVENGPEEEVSFLVEETLRALIRATDYEDMSKSLNGLLLKSLETLHPNCSFRVLVRLLDAAFVVPVESADDKYPDLVIKCLWKLTKQIGAFLASDRLQMAPLLRELESFLSSIPPMEWKARSTQKLPYEDSPLKTIKTIVHELTQSKGLAVLERALEELAPTSFTVGYVKTFLQAAHIAIPETLLQATPQKLNPKKRAWSPRSPAASNESLLSPGQIDERMQDICSKICSKPDTRAGLMELYQFKLDNPRSLVQIDAFITSLGDFFHKYIERGLARIEAEKASTAQVASLGGDSITANHQSGAPGDMESYRQKLHALKAQMFGPSAPQTPTKAPHDNGANSNGGANVTSPLRTRLESPAAKLARFGSPRGAPNGPAPNDAPREDDQVMSSLKERLARLKQQ